MSKNLRQVKVQKEPASRPLTSFEIRLYDKFRQAVQIKPELDLATRLATARERNWPRVYAAVLDIERAIGQTLHEAGFLSEEERHNLVASSYAGELLRKNPHQKIYAEEATPKPLTLEHAYVLLGIALSKAFTADAGSDASS